MVLAVLGGAVAGLGQAPFDWPALGLLGLVAAFALMRAAATPRRAAWVGFAFGAGYFLLTLHWIYAPFLVEADRHGWMAPFAVLFLACGMALLWVPAFWLARACAMDRAAHQRAAAPFGLRRFRPMAVLACAWGLAELSRASLFTGFPWAMPSHMLVDSVLGQGAAWVGASGLNPLLFAFAGGLALLLQSGRSLLALVGAGLFAALMAWSPAPQPVEPHRPLVRLVQTSAPQHLRWDPDHMLSFFQNALHSTEAKDSTSARPPDLVVWPETAVPYLLEHAQAALQRVVQARQGTPFVLGIMRREDGRTMNSAIMVDRQGQVAQVYDKLRLVPFGEYVPFVPWLQQWGVRGLAAPMFDGFRAGTQRQLMQISGVGRALVLICYEAIFARDIRAYGERPDFLLNLSNDGWFGQFAGPSQFLVQARIRAIEFGLPVGRATNTGISALIDARGQIRASVPLGVAGYVDSLLPPPLPPPLYARSGDLPLMVVLLALGLACAWPPLAETMRRRFKP